MRAITNASTMEEARQHDCARGFVGRWRGRLGLGFRLGFRLGLGFGLP